MAKTKSSKFQDSRTFTCSVPAEVIPVDPEYPNTIFVVRNYDDDKKYNAYGEFQYEKRTEQMVCQISSKFPMFINLERNSQFNTDEYHFYIAPKKVSSRYYSYEDVVTIKQSNLMRFTYSSNTLSSELNVDWSGTFSYNGQPYAPAGQSPTSLDACRITIVEDDGVRTREYIGRDGVAIVSSKDLLGNITGCDVDFSETYGKYTRTSSSIGTQIYLSAGGWNFSLQVLELLKNYQYQNISTYDNQKTSCVTNCISSQTRDFSTLSDWQSYVETEIWGN